MYFLYDKKKYSPKYLNKKKEILNFIIIHDDNFLADLTFSRHNRGEQPVAGSGGSQSVQCYLPVQLPDQAVDQHVRGGVQGPAAMCVSCRIQLHRAGTLHTHSLCVNLVKPDEVS